MMLGRLAAHLCAPFPTPSAAAASPPTPKGLRVGAHRGAMSHAPENTLAAFERAIEMGAYRIECDVRQTRDGVLVLMHDATIDRTTDGEGTLRDLTLAELGAVRAVTGAGGGTGSEPVPTLEAALACAKGRCRLLVELKDEDIAEATVALIESAGMTPNCTISTFHEPSLKRCREVSDTIGTCYFMPPSAAERTLSPTTLAEELGVTLVCVVGGERVAFGAADEYAAASEWLGQAVAAGLDTRCGFSDSLDKSEARKLFESFAEMGVQEIGCGRPDWIAEFVAEHK